MLKDTKGLPSPLLNWWTDFSEGDTKFYISSEGRDDHLGEPIAIVPSREDDDGKPMLKEAESYAELIAAAPDLLAACEAARDSIQLLYGEDELFRQLQNAIAKARGQ